MTADPRVKDVGEIRTAHLFDMVVDLNPRLPIGSGPFGRRVLFGAAGDTFTGPRLHGDGEMPAHEHVPEPGSGVE